MFSRIHRRLLTWALACGLLFSACAASYAQTQAEAPLTNQEFVRLLYQLPKYPQTRDALIDEVRRRGISFPLTDGLRSLIATKSGNDALLRRTIEEAERRRQNPSAFQPPSAAEASAVLEKARVATLAATEAMPDFIVRQQIIRSYALGNTENWQTSDRLTIIVTYRASQGEDYRVLAVNGMPPNKEIKEGRSYQELGGTSSSGEYVTALFLLFRPESQTIFQAVDTDLIRNRRAIVYEFEVKKINSRQTLTTNGNRTITVGYRGRVWIDRENYRVLRIEDIATDISPDFPIRAKTSLTDYDWITIAERQYLLPITVDLRMTTRVEGSDQLVQARNEIRFRNYQKYGTEVKIIEDVGDEEPPTPEQSPKPEKKP
ncbi:MAG: hypothetical protein ICV60_02725 [Pyrinomonadaceae bacterium]|nr:hypothetical protein [Pyrinomonadaceae bacterium]